MAKPGNFIAYQGPRYTIEWYYTEKGVMPALEYFNDLEDDEKIKTFRPIQADGNRRENL